MAETRGPHLLRGALPWLCLALLSGAPAARGQDTNYVRGFRLLARLGAPDVSQATYVHFSGWPGMELQPLLPYDRESAGNAWMLQETRGSNGVPAKGIFVFNDSFVVEATSGYGADWYGPRTGETPTEARQPCGQWQAVDVSKDIKRVTAFLRDMEKDRLRSIRLTPAVQGRLLLFSFQLYQRGQGEQAGRILDRLFPLVEEREGVVAAALNQLADGQYETLYRTFQTNHDWRAYHGGVTNLLARYPREWKNRPAIALLQERLAQRLAAADTVTFATNGLCALDLQQASALLQARAVRVSSPWYGQSALAWLLPATWNTGAPPASDLDLAIRARGLQAFPLLLALGDDTVLTEADAWTVRGQPFYSSPFRLGAGGSAEERFHALQRPATRGEVAGRILTELLPPHLSSTIRDQPRPDGLLQLARGFYDEHRDADAHKLAALYLRTGYGSAGSPAMRFLLHAAVTGRVAVLEKYLLEGPEHVTADAFRADDMATRDSNLAEDTIAYAAFRGAAARPLVERIAARIEKDAAEFQKPTNYSFSEPAEEARYVTGERARMRESAARLKAIVYDQSLDHVLGAALSSSADSADPARSILMLHLSDMPLRRAYDLLLAKAVTLDAPSNRAAAAQWIVRCMMDRTDATAEPESRREDLLAHNGIAPTNQAAAWRVLVADDRSAGGETHALVSDVFLCLNEQLFTPSNAVRASMLYCNPLENRAGHLIARHAAAGRELVRSRVLARLAGCAEHRLPPYPEDAPLSPDETAALVQRLTAARTREQAAQAAAGMSLRELSALPGLLQTHPALNRTLASLASTIGQVSAPGDTALEQQLAKWRNQAPTPALWQEMREVCVAKSRAQKPVCVLLARQENFGGCELRVAPVELGQPSTDRDDEQAYDTADDVRGVLGYTGLVCARGVYGVGQWRTVPPPHANKWRVFRASAPEQEREFQQALDDLLRETTDASSAYVVKFTTKGRNVP